MNRVVSSGIADAASAAADGSVEGAISTASVAASAPDAALGGAAGAVGAAVVGAAVEEAANGGGGMNLNPVDFLTGVTESSITGLHGFLQGLGVPNAYGLSIIFFTVLVKIITFPLTYQQLSSTTKMQALSPKVRLIFVGQSVGLSAHLCLVVKGGAYDSELKWNRLW